MRARGAALETPCEVEVRRPGFGARVMVRREIDGVWISSQVPDICCRTAQDRGIENDRVFTSRRGILSDPVCGTDNVAMTNGNSVSGSSGLVKGDSLSAFNKVKENQSRTHTSLQFYLVKMHSIRTRVKATIIRFSHLILVSREVQESPESDVPHPLHREMSATRWIPCETSPRLEGADTEKRGRGV